MNSNTYKCKKIKTKTQTALKALEQNTGKYLYDLRTGEDCLNETQNKINGYI